MISAGEFEVVVDNHGTPVYVYEEGMIRERLSQLLMGIRYSPLKILYAVKANSNPCILEIFTEQVWGSLNGEEGVVGIDAVSPGELALALGVGFQPQDIIFTGNNITDDEMDFAVEKGVLLNIDSLSRLEKVGRKYSGRQVCVRINPDVGAGHHDHCITGGPKSKFGIWSSEVEKAKRIARQFSLQIVGIHQHIGSQILEVATFLRAMEVLLGIAPSFPNLNFIDFGGGFGVPYKPREKPLNIELLGRELSKRFADFCRKSGRKLTLIVEPGRYLVAEAGYLLVRVTTVKRSPNGRVFVGVDSGFNHLIRPAMYGSYHPIENISNPDGPKKKVDIVGNLCESGDKFAKMRSLRQPREGDLLVIKNAGAYGYSMSSNYNLRPRPAEVLIRTDGTIQEIRKREAIEDLIEA